MDNLAEHEPVAIIGMAGRFPGAADLGQFWANLRSGTSSIRFPSDDELLDAGVSASALADPSYVRAAAVAPDVDTFDAEFFGLTPSEARGCDPQLRQFLACAHAAVTDAGYDVERLSTIAVFGSAGPNRYPHPVRPAGVQRSPSGPGDSLAPLTAYPLGRHGPSLAGLRSGPDSLVAVHLAAAALLAGECELALAGGVDIDVPLGHGYWWEEGGPRSRDGQCRPFDRAATGTVFGSGVGVVVLKRLSAALADRDHIYAVIRATAVDDSRPTGSTAVDDSGPAGSAAPGDSRPAALEGLAAVVTTAMTRAGITGRDLSLVEAHAAGDPLGDAAEVAALSVAYDRLGPTESGRCALTSVKGAVGHLGHAAGIASLIAVALSLENETIAASGGYAEPNPALRLDGSPFHVPTRTTPWPRQADRPRLAAVTTIGDGATAHVVLAEAPVPTPVTRPDQPRVVVWSGRTADAADRYRELLAGHLQGPGRSTFLATVNTLQSGRTAFAYRGAVVAADATEAVALLRDPHSAGHLTGPRPVTPSRIAFVYPGQGTQHIAMALDLYERAPVYAAAFDQCLDLFEAEGLPLRRLWREADENELLAPRIAQPLIFSVEYALTALWRSWGITPDAVVGHSLGEMTAGLVAGVYGLADAARAIARRSAALQRTPPGGMLAVAAARADVVPYLTGDVSIAVVNGPTQVVVAGPTDQLAAVAQAMEQAGLNCRPVRSTHPSHTPLTAPARPIFEQVMREMPLRPPTIDFYSAATGRLVTAAEATDPTWWSRQLVEPVVFGEALDTLTATDGRLVLVELGPGRALTTVARQHPTVLAGRHQMLPTLAQRRVDPLAEVRSALTAVAGVWTEGHAVDWAAVEDLADVGRVPLPGYPFERTRYWIDAAPADGTDAEITDQSPFSLVTWLEKPRVPVAPDAGRQLATALLPADPVRSAAIVARLTEAGLQVVPVVTGESYEDGGDRFTIRAGEPWDLARMFRALADRQTPPAVLVHAATLGRTEGAVPDQMGAGFLAGAELVRQAARVSASGPRPGLLVLTEAAVDVSGHDPLDAGTAALTGLVRTVPQEDVVARAKLIDIGNGVSDADLVEEIRDRGGDRLVALRGGRRWVPTERPLAVVGDDAPVIRTGGVYLVTGGTGGLGGVVATQLAATGQRPVLVLASRSGTARAELLGELDRLGATVDVVACDVTDRSALSTVVDGVVARYGAVHGVFHLAGTIGTGLVAFGSSARAVATLGPKVAGALALAEVFADRPPLDLFVAFSSRAALEGVAGGSDYAAANAVLDALVCSGALAAERMLTIDWPRWRDIGLAADVPDDPGRGLDPDQGAALLMRLLAARTPRQVGVRPFVDGHPSWAATSRRRRAAVAPTPTGPTVARTAEPAGPPTTSGRLRSLWTTLLGRAEIAPDADFFDLGGNSLTAVELMSRVRAEFQVDLGIVALFDHPTLDALAAQIDRRDS